MAKPRSSFSFALDVVMNSFAEASDGGTTRFFIVAVRPGSISHFASVGRSSSRTPRSRTRSPTRIESP